MPRASTDAITSTARVGLLGKPRARRPFAIRPYTVTTVLRTLWRSFVVR